MLRRKPWRFIKKLRSLGRGEMAFAARAWALAPVVEASLATLGLKQTLGLIRSAYPHGGRSGTAPSVERAQWLVDAAYRVHVVSGTCLPRALVQYALLRRAGSDVRFVIGVDKPRSEPLDAHAWVEDAAGPSRERRFAPILVTP